MSLRDRIRQRLKRMLGFPEAPEAGPVPAKAEPVKAEPVKPEPAKPEPAKPEPAKPEPAKPEPAKAAEPWQLLGRSDQVREGKAGSFGLPGTETVVAVFRKDGQLYAIDNACAHEDGPIGEGAIHGNLVQCPYHDWEYDFTTGACRTDPERRQTCWKIREQDGGIWLGPILRQGTAARGGEHNDGMEVIKQ